MNKPFVSIICLCFNQQRFVIESLESAINQTYENTEIIIVDDGSNDGSKSTIRKWLSDKPDLTFIDLKLNIGNTKSFNKGLKLAKGKYVIDLACDDVLDTERVDRQVSFFEGLEPNFGVVYSDAIYLNEQGIELDSHFSDGKYVHFEGDIYERLIDTYFIPPPTMMMKKAVLDELDGYDESLAYEDFDFWIRSSRKWKYAYQDQKLTKIRRVSFSHSSNLYAKGDLQLASTLKVCKKVNELNNNSDEDQALVKRLKYEIRHAFIEGKKDELFGFLELLNEIQKIPFQYKFIRCIGRLGINISWIKTVARWLILIK